MEMVTNRQHYGKHSEIILPPAGIPTFEELPEVCSHINRKDPEKLSFEENTELQHHINRKDPEKPSLKKDTELQYHINRKDPEKPFFEGPPEIPQTGDAEDDIRNELFDYPETTGRRNPSWLGHDPLCISHSNQEADAGDNVIRKKISHATLWEIDQYILNQGNIYAIKTTRNDTFLMAYNDETGSFSKVFRDDFRLYLNRSSLNHFAIQNLTKGNILELWDMIVSEPSIQADISLFDTEQLCWNCANGVLLMDREGRPKLVKHSPEYRFKSFLHGEYLKGKKHPKPKLFYAAVKRNFPGKSMRTLFLQTFAYLLSWNGSSKVFFYLLGASDTGKSMFLKLLRRFVGSEEISEIPIEKLSDRFSASYLSDKRVNICGEVEHCELKKSSFLKSLVGQDVQVAEYKGKNHFSFVPRVRLVFSANEMLKISPSIAEDALFRRVIFIEFVNPMPKDEQILNFDKLLYEEEGDEIITYLAMVYHKWLQGGRKFDIAQRSEELKKQFIMQKGDVQQFIEDLCTLEAGAREHTIDLYAAYEAYCNDNCFDSISRGKFSRELELLAHRLGIQRIRYRKNTANPQFGYEGICLRRQ